MPNTPEPRPAPATGHCPQRYRSERLAKRGAWSIADHNGTTTPIPPVHCDRCDGWHLRAAAPTTTDATATTTGD